MQPFDAWMAALEARHLADLRPPEVARALRALSSAYVERRGRLASGAALDGAGKRAAFALFYGPVHYVLVSHIVRSLDATPRAGGPIVDLGCGTGVAGAAWALAQDPPAEVLGLDRHPWAVDEARWTYRTLGLTGTARQFDARRLTLRKRAGAVVAAFVLNELAPDVREALLNDLAALARGGTTVLVVEPIARGIAPWMDAWAPACAGDGGRHDEWRFTADLPDAVRRLERAAGLDRSELTARSLYWPAAGASGAGERQPPRPAAPWRRTVT
jgi:SAM-dependent methyltransferase